MADHPGFDVVTHSKRKVVIYKCKNCHQILGNSDFLLTDIEDAKFVYVTEVENALMSTRLICSIDSKDKNCTFHNLECQNCRTEVGIHYSSVTDALKHLNNAYRLKINCINSVHTMVNREAEENASNAEILAKLKEHSAKIDDIAVMLVEALLDRTHIKESITIHAGLIGTLKKEIDEIKGNNS